MGFLERIFSYGVAVVLAILLFMSECDRRKCHSQAVDVVYNCEGESVVFTEYLDLPAGEGKVPAEDAVVEPRRELVYVADTSALSALREEYDRVLARLEAERDYYLSMLSSLASSDVPISVPDPLVLYSGEGVQDNIYYSWSAKAVLLGEMKVDFSPVPLPAADSGEKFNAIGVGCRVMIDDQFDYGIYGSFSRKWYRFGVARSLTRPYWQFDAGLNIRF